MCIGRGFAFLFAALRRTRCWLHNQWLPVSDYRRCEIEFLQQYTFAVLTKRQDFRFHSELQRTSALSANATATRLQKEVHLLRAFMTNRLGLDATTLPAPAATDVKGTNTDTPSITDRY